MLSSKSSSTTMSVHCSTGLQAQAPDRAVYYAVTHNMHGHTVNCQAEFAGFHTIPVKQLCSEDFEIPLTAGAEDGTTWVVFLCSEGGVRLGYSEFTIRTSPVGARTVGAKIAEKASSVSCQYDDSALEVPGDRAPPRSPKKPAIESRRCMFNNLCMRHSNPTLHYLQGLGQDYPFTPSTGSVQLSSVYKPRVQQIQIGSTDIFRAGSPWGPKLVGASFWRKINEKVGGLHSKEIWDVPVFLFVPYAQYL